MDHNEEEWEKFQKEISDEVATAQEILVEDRNEATTDRQLEDIEGFNLILQWVANEI